jgi:hypothetical protein
MEQELGQLTQAWTSENIETMRSNLARGILEDKRFSFILEKLIYQNAPECRPVLLQA